MGCLLSFPSWAAETRAEYKEEVAPIREELRALEAELKPIREENRASAARYKSIQNMNQLLEQKKARQDSLKEINRIWQQIDDLLDEG